MVSRLMYTHWRTMARIRARRLYEPQVYCPAMVPIVRIPGTDLYVGASGMLYTRKGYTFQPKFS